MHPSQRWDARYSDAEVTETRPARVLEEFAHLLPREGRALEIACGLGANALFLARHGLETTAWDISPVAIGKLSHYARQQRLPLYAETHDAVAMPPRREGYQVIVVSRFLDRRLLPTLPTALAPGGLLYYQTFIRNKVSTAGPANPDFLLASNELLHAFPMLTLLAYREEGPVGDIQQGWRNEAMLVAQKPAP